MRTLFNQLAHAGVIALALTASGAPRAAPATAIDELQVNSTITLRRMVVRPPRPKATVLLLHGFPETLLTWNDVAQSLGNDYEVHAFDWPGYGQSSRPPVEQFSYAPSAYAQVLRDYIRTAGIDTAHLLIYGTDIGGLPALLLALDEPGIARRIVVGDFAPLNRPQYMHANLQALKQKPTSDAVHAAMSRNRDEILENCYRRGFDKGEQFDIAPALKADMARGWERGGISAADAFHHYYANFTRDQEYLESRLAALKTPLAVVWGERDFFISTAMGSEFAQRTHASLTLLPGMGHYPHLQSPQRTAEEIRAALSAIEQQP